MSKKKKEPLILPMGQGYVAIGSGAIGHMFGVGFYLPDKPGVPGEDLPDADKAEPFLILVFDSAEQCEEVHKALMGKKPWILSLLRIDAKPGEKASDVVGYFRTEEAAARFLDEDPSIDQGRKLAGHYSLEGPED